MRFVLLKLLVIGAIILASSFVGASTYSVDLASGCNMYFVCQDTYYAGEEFRAVCMFENKGSGDVWFTINFKFGWETSIHSYSGNQVEPGEKPDWRPILLEGDIAGISRCQNSGSYPVYVSFSFQSLGMYGQLVEETGEWIHVCNVKYILGGVPSGEYTGSSIPSSDEGYYTSYSSYYGGLNEAFYGVVDLAQTHIESQLTLENILATIVIGAYGGEYKLVLTFLWEVYQILK